MSTAMAATHAMRRAGLAAVTACAMLCSAGAALADGAAPDSAAPDRATPSRWLTLGVLTGASRLDPHLADYQWKVDPRVAWGAQAIAGVGRFGLGPRVWTAQTTQHVDLADDPDPNVRSTRLDLVCRVRVLSSWGTDLEACASTGWLHLGYAPDHVSIPSGGGGSIDVALGPVDAWSAGSGLALRRPVTGPWAATLEVESQLFAMDTAHRSGSTIVMGRERFSEWSARLELARIFGRR